MSFLRHAEIYHFDEGAIPPDRALAHRNDEFPAGYSLAGCTPAEPASASPAGAHFATKRLRSTIQFQRTANSVLTVCLTLGDNPIVGLITALSMPLMILNMVFGIGSGIWLAVLRDWNPILLGVAFFVVSTTVLGLVFIPASLLAAPGLYFAEKGKTVQSVCPYALSSLYSYAVITAWSCGVLFVLVKGATAHALFPRLVWSYGVAIQPLAYMALKDYRTRRKESFSSQFATFFAHVAYLIIMLLVIFSPITLLGAMKVSAGFMLVGFVVQMTASA